MQQWRGRKGNTTGGIYDKQKETKITQRWNKQTNTKKEQI